MEITFSIKHFDQLTTVELYDLLALRSAVFVVEQDCVYQDLDGLDQDAYHALAYWSGKFVGTLRILKVGIAYKEVAIGRVVSHGEYRDLKIGHVLMKAGMDFVQNELRENAVRLSAQSHLLGFYEKHGFASTGKEYLEDGIPHTEMLYSK